MGRAIESLALARGHEIVGRLDIADAPPFPQADVAIEFTQPEAAVRNLVQCFEQRLPVVCGTTGWGSELSHVRAACEQNNGTLFYSSNFSLGVNIFFKINEHLARIMDSQSDYDVTLSETHHTHKKDAPSGTAITLAEGIVKNVQRKENWTTEPGDAKLLTVSSSRIDPAPGTHVVRYRSNVDELEIRHTAFSRTGFASGALAVAEWLPGRRGVLTMDDFLKF